MAKKTKEELRVSESIELARISARADVWKEVARAVWKTAIPICIAIAVYAMAGKNTDFKAVVEATLKWDVSRYAFMACTLFCGGGWYRERILRKREVAELSASVKDYETLIDPERRSSGLTKHGTPAPLRAVPPQTGETK